MPLILSNKRPMADVTWHKYLNTSYQNKAAQSAGAVEYTDCISAEG